MVEEEQIHSPKFLRRLRIATLVFTAAAAGCLVMNDWEGAAGRRNVFSKLQTYIQGHAQPDAAKEDLQRKRH